MKLQSRAQLKHLRMSPQKVRLVVDLVRGMRAEDAVNQLRFSKKHAARPVLKLLNSCIANALNNDRLKLETLAIKEAFVDEGKVLHRWMPRAMGRATPIKKRMSHVTVILEGDVDEKVAAKSAKEEARAAAQKSEQAHAQDAEVSPKTAETDQSADKGSASVKKSKNNS